MVMGACASCSSANQDPLTSQDPLTAVYYYNHADVRLPKSTIDALRAAHRDAPFPLPSEPGAAHKWECIARAAGLDADATSAVMTWHKAAGAPDAILRLPDRASLRDSVPEEELTDIKPTLSMLASNKARRGAAPELVERDFRSTQRPRPQLASKALQVTTLLTPRGMASAASTPRGSQARIGQPTQFKHLEHRSSLEAAVTSGAGESACFTHEGGGGGKGKENQDAFFSCARERT